MNYRTNKKIEYKLKYAYNNNERKKQQLNQGLLFTLHKICINLVKTKISKSKQQKQQSRVSYRVRFHLC